MTNPIQLLRDFLKWRKEKYDEAFSNVLEELAREQYSRKTQLDQFIAYQLGIEYGIEHRKKILNQVKI